MKQSVNWNISYTSLYLFDLVFITSFAELCGLSWSVSELFSVTF